MTTSLMLGIRLGLEGNGGAIVVILGLFSNGFINYSSEERRQ